MSVSTIALRLVIGGDAKGAKAALKGLGAESKKTQSDFGKGLKATQQAAAVGLTAIAGVAAKGIQQYTLLTTSVAALQRQSKVSAEDASLLVGQWQRYGVAIEAGSKGVMMLSKQIDAANIGTQTSIDTFARLGITLDDLKTMSPYEVLEQVRSKLSQLPPSAERTAISAKLLGKGFMSMSKWIAASSTDLDALNRQLKGSGQVMDETELARAKEDLKQMALLQVDLRGLFVEVGRSAMPILRDMVPGLKKLLAVVKPLAPHLIEIGGALAAFLVVTKVATGLGTMVTMLGKLKTLLVGGKIASGLASVAGAGGVLGGGGVGTGKIPARVFSVGASGAASTTIGAGERTVATSLLTGGGAGGAAAAGGGALAAAAVPVLLVAVSAAAGIALAMAVAKYGPKPTNPRQEAFHEGVASPHRGGQGAEDEYAAWAGRRLSDRLAAEAKSVRTAVDAAVKELSVKAATQTGAQFRGTLLQLSQLREIAAKKIQLGNVDGKHTDAELRTARDRIMGALHITVQQADRLMGQMFKDWRPQNQLMPKIDKAAAAVEHRIAALRQRAAKDIRMGNLDATQLLNEIGRVSAALGGIRGGARTAGDAVANALKGKAGGGGSYRGHFMAAGGYVRRTPGGTLLRVGEGRYDEVVAQVLPGRGQQQSGGGGGDIVFKLYVDKVVGTDERAARQFWNLVKPIAMSDMRMKMAMSRG